MRGNRVESMQMRKKNYSERWSRLVPSREKSTLMMIRELFEDDLENL
jgi:hypothetical protein